jgi:hypothetical protein
MTSKCCSCAGCPWSPTAFQKTQKKICNLALLREFGHTHAADTFPWSCYPLLRSRVVMTNVENAHEHVTGNVKLVKFLYPALY